jgi:hypothetical protein
VTGKEFVPAAKRKLPDSANNSASSKDEWGFIP